MFCAYPEHQKGFFLAHNQDREDARYDHFDALMVGALDVKTPAQPALAAPIPEIERQYSGRYVASPSRLSQTSLIDRLFSVWTLDLHTSPPTLKEGLFGTERPLVRVGERLYRQSDRQQATFALDKDPAGTPLIHASYVRLRGLPWSESALLWFASCAAVVGLLGSLVVPVFRRVRHNQPLRRAPLFFATVFLCVAVVLMMLQPWQALGEKTSASIFLALASIVWLPAAVWQGYASTAASMRMIALSTLVGIGLLYAFGLWPLSLWRI
jgi:hypothetical protein